MRAWDPSGVLRTSPSCVKRQVDDEVFIKVVDSSPFNPTHAFFGFKHLQKRHWSKLFCFCCFPYSFLKSTFKQSHALKGLSETRRTDGDRLPLKVFPKVQVTCLFENYFCYCHAVVVSVCYRVEVTSPLKSEQGRPAAALDFFVIADDSVGWDTKALYTAHEPLDHTMLWSLSTKLREGYIHADAGGLSCIENSVISAHGHVLAPVVGDTFYGPLLRNAEVFELQKKYNAFMAQLSIINWKRTTS